MTARPSRPADPAFDGTSYAAATAHHRAHDDEVLAPVRWRAGLRVLDVGCGVGDLTRSLADLVAPGGEVLGVDASASQVDVARAGGARPDVRFAVARVQDLDAVVPDGWADVVVSVATLHWVPEADQPRAHDRLARVLAPGGTLRLDQGGAGQIGSARPVLDDVAAAHGLGPSPWFFPDARTLGDLLAGAGLVVDDVRLVRQRRALPDRDAMAAWLVSQVLPGYLRGPDAPRGEDRRALERAAVAACATALRRADGSYDQDYVRAQALARAPLGGSRVDRATAYP
ncbi:class I SAM-dependent methyltransferase [Aquipuribacter sp. SD81]|uniref:class I SAM-dependent methyltransferase n=1 Tax=Aquipuribacter sp. SD81 TaxID=3127703 RepID=UPI0030180FCD